jgi:hypothetical protein
MPFFDWDAELSETDCDALMEAVVRRVQALGLQVPAILFLEMHKPMTRLASQALLVGSPGLAVLFGPQNVQRYVKFLESRENIERLIQRIEETTHPTTEREPPERPTPRA